MAFYDKSCSGRCEKTVRPQELLGVAAGLWFAFGGSLGAGWLTWTPTAARARLARVTRHSTRRVGLVLASAWVALQGGVVRGRARIPVRAGSAHLGGQMRRTYAAFEKGRMRTYGLGIVNFIQINNTFLVVVKSVTFVCFAWCAIPTRPTQTTPPPTKRYRHGERHASRRAKNDPRLCM